MYVAPTSESRRIKTVKFHKAFFTMKTPFGIPTFGKISYLMCIGG